MSNQRHISMVEIVMILIVVAIISSTAIPSFMVEETDSQQAAVEGIAGSLGSASAINFAVRSISQENGIAVKNCGDIANTLEGTLDPQYQIKAKPITEGSTEKCVVQSHSGKSAPFIGHGIL